MAAVRLLPALALALLAGACDRDGGGKHGMNDARAVAMVEAAQKQLPPRVPVTPQSLAGDVTPSAGSAGAQCSFATPATVTGPTFMAGPVRGEIKIDDVLQVLSADHGSTEVVPGVRQKYDGKQYAVEIARDLENPGNVGDRSHLPAKLTIHDRFDRPVYFAVGLLSCR